MSDQNNSHDENNHDDLENVCLDCGKQDDSMWGEVCSDCNESNNEEV